GAEQQQPAGVHGRGLAAPARPDDGRRLDGLFRYAAREVDDAVAVVVEAVADLGRALADVAVGVVAVVRVVRAAGQAGAGQHGVAGDALAVAVGVDVPREHPRAR